MGYAGPSTPGQVEGPYEFIVFKPSFSLNSQLNYDCKFEAIGKGLDFGPIDIVAYNMKTKRFLKADVKYLPHRLPAPNRNKKSQARRTKSKFQIEHNVKFITVDENGNCKII